MADTGEPKHYLIGRIREALSEDPRVNEINIQVTVTGSKIFLHGSVPTQERKDAITQVASEIVPSYQIFNETAVESYEGTTEVEQLS